MLLNTSSGRVNGPAIEPCQALIWTVAIAGKHLRVTHDVQYDTTVLVLVAIHRMKNIARLYLVPADIGSITVPGQQTHTSAVVSLPGVGEG